MEPSRSPGDDPAPSSSSSAAGLADQVDAALASLWSGNSAALDRLVQSCDGDLAGASPPGPEQPPSNGLGDALRDTAAHLARPAVLAAPPAIPGFEIIGELGRGGMGVVYEALQLHPRRSVALKLMQPGRESDAYHRRLFEREIRALASLEHTNIASLHQAGTTSDGRAYFVMELVRGRAIDQYAQDAALNVAARLELFCQVCDGVHHAHMRGVIHRDLKPSNILVLDEPSSASFGASGRVKIMDFGLARLVQPDGMDATLSIDAGRIKGTISYMSPEQVAGRRGDNRDSRQGDDARTDVFSLGVILFQLLTGRLPLDIRGQSLAEIARMIEQQEAPPLGRIDRALRGDLEVIAAKALSHEPGRRYQSAAQLAEDVRRYLRHEPIFARPATAIYQLRKFARRNRTFVAAAVIVLLVLLLGVVGTTAGLLRAHKQATEALRQRQIADDRSAESVLARRTAEIKAYAAGLAAAEAALASGDVATARENLLQSPPELRGWEWRCLAAQLDASVATLSGHNGPVWTIVTSRNGEFFATSSWDQTIRIWDARTTSTIAVLHGHNNPVPALALSPDDRLLASAGSDRVVRLWSAPIGDDLGRLCVEETAVHDLTFDPSGRWLVVCTAAGAHVWDVASRTSVSFLKAPVIEAPAISLCVAVSPDGSQLMMGMSDGLLVRWNLALNEPPRTTPSGMTRVIGLDFSNDGTRFSASSSYGEITVFDAASLEPVCHLYGHNERVERAVFSPDDSTIAAASWDSTIRVWDARTGKPLRLLLGHQLPVARAEFSPDGRRLLSAGSDATIRAWDLTSEDPPALVHPSNRVQCFVVDPRGRWLLAAYSEVPRSEGAILWDIARRQPLAVLYDHKSNTLQCEIIRLTRSGDGALVAGSFCDGQVAVWNTQAFDALLDSGSVSFSWEADSLPTIDPILRLPKADAGVPNSESSELRAPRLTAVAMSRDGSRIFAGGEGLLYMWDAATGAPNSDESELGTPDQAAGWKLADPSIGALAVDPTAALLLCGGSAGRVELLNLKLNQWEPPLENPGGLVRAITFNAAGTLLATADTAGKIALWDWPSRALRFQLTGHVVGVTSLAFAPDGQRLASGSDDHTIRLWDPASGQLIATFHGHTYLVNCVAFSDDGRWLYSGSADRSIRLWEAPPP